MIAVMFDLHVLGSGSAGNCAVVCSGKTRILIDSGLSARQITLRLQAVGIDPCSLDGILVTHEHIDHVSGLEVLCKKNPIPVYCNSLTAAAIGRERKLDWRIFQSGSDFAVGEFGVQTFPVPHDAAEPVGYVLNHGNAALGFVTDLGYATKLVFERVRHVQTLFIETNHDEKLLQNDTRRPWPVKQRIMSRHGHLSNTAAAEVAGQLLGQQLRRVILGHLSRDCNTPELALGAVRSHLKIVAGACGPGPGSQNPAAETVELFCASQHEASPRFTVS